MWDTSVITNAGLTLLRRWAAGGTLTIDGAKAGRGSAPVETIASSTELVEEVQTLEIAGYTYVESGVRFKIVIQPPAQGYVANQVGIWAHLNDGESTLLALYQDEDGIDIPSTAEMPEFAYNLYALVTMSTTGDLHVNITSALYVTPEQLQEELDALEKRLKGEWQQGSNGALTSMQQTLEKRMDEKDSSLQKALEKQISELQKTLEQLMDQKDTTVKKDISKEITNLQKALNGLITYGTSDMTPGVTPLETGKVYLMYENP